MTTYLPRPATTHLGATQPRFRDVAGIRLAENLDAYQAAVERRIAPLTRAGWSAKRAFERFPRTTYALARLPVTFRVLAKLLEGDLPHPAAARGGELAAIRAIYAVSRAAATGTTGSRSAASS